MKKEKITVLGDGAWATTLAILLSENGHEVKVWSAFPDYLEILDKKRVNDIYLKGVKIPENIIFEKNIKKAIESSEFIVFAIPSKFFREVAQRIKKEKTDLKGKIFINVAKGLEQKTLKRMTEIINDELGSMKTAVLSGPSIATEVARHLPTLVVVASKDKKISKRIQNMFFNEYFRVYTSSDVIGVELAGPLKNIIAVVAGMSDGLGFGSNSKAALLSRGLVEIQRLGTKMGAKKKTFFGLAGLGDLATTCMSSDSRNRNFGERIAKGEKMKEIVKSMASVAEGATTSEAVYELSKKYKVEMPISEQLYYVLYENKHPLEALKELMGRKKKQEDIWR